MTTIFSVDATPQSPQRDPNRPSAKDFAHELAKQDAQAKTQLQDDAKPQTEFEEKSLPETSGTTSVPVATESQQVVSAPVPTILLTDMEQLAQATVTLTGVTEALLGARVFGWHAMAQAYLSELSAADSRSDKSLTPEGEDVSSSNVSDEPAPTQAASASIALETVEASVAAPQVELINPVQSRLASDDTAPAHIAELATADASASSYWSERSLRFTRQRDGSQVAWLRDFRLSDTEASHLIQIVLNDAQAKGVALSKIMLNGREAWTSPNGN